MTAPTKLFLEFDDIPQHNRWEVIDEEGFCIGDGAEIDNAVASARKRSNAPIYLNGELYDEVKKNTSSKLFLDFKEDSKFHVIDENKKSIGAAYEIPDAVKQARLVSNVPIDFEDSYCGFTRLMVTEKPSEAIADSETFIAALAEIGGMKVTKLFDDNMHFIGYTMDPIEENDFIKAELATEQLENEQVSAIGSYLGDD
ncbi:hypothetical protein [Methanobrevibacter sp.]|uniref:hypothetical protein n=1 Tax=Methanobrevibacter sp. TaxID=66852 RepID=UPI0025DEF6BB|nr:hypothetical protein [Methanobrevibacter sp.]MBQ6512233.1 hypothetical protein [Methanobrevibacter sp.]